LAFSVSAIAKLLSWWLFQVLLGKKMPSFYLFFPDRFQLFNGLFTTATTGYIGPYIGRTMSGQYSINECLVECFFTPSNDCHFAATIGTTCYIGTFKLWPIEYPPGYATTTVYIFNGKKLG